MRTHGYRAQFAVASRAGGLAQAKKPMPRYIVDRFEGSDWAVLEDDQARTFNVPRAWLPTDASEGTVLMATTASGTSLQAVRFEIDPEATRQRQASGRRLRD